MKMHTDTELAELLGAGVAERATIHEWPLSRVQKVELDDGRRLVYKVQLPPSVEPDFYARADSPLLPGHRLLGGVGEGTAMTIDWVTSPTLAALASGEAELVAHARRVIDAFGGLDQGLPVHVDIGSVEAWLGVVDETLRRMRILVDDGRFTMTDVPAVQRIHGWATSREVIDEVIAAPRIIQWDMKADQIFVRPDGYTVIDWQRPARAPAEVDLVAFLVAAEIDPSRYVAEPLVGVHWLLRLQWAVDAQYELFPESRWPLFDQWAAEAVAQISPRRVL